MLKYAYMKKTYLILIVLAVIFAIIGYKLGWLDNGPEVPAYDTNTLPSRLD